jgi:predicted dehydrogenase
MAKDWINLAVVGCGRIYNDGHRNAFIHPATHHIAVIGLCDLQEKLAKDQFKWLKKGYEKNLKAAKKAKNAADQERIKFALDNLKIYTSYDKMLDQLEGTLEIVDNCTPGMGHIPLSVQAMEHGCHAMAEKPPGLNWMDVKQAVEAEKKTGKHFQLNEHVCFDRPIMKAREVIAAGKIGKVEHIRVEFGHNGPYVPHQFSPNGLPHFIDPLMSGGGCLQDLAPHGISHAFWPVGPGAKVVSCQTKKIERRKNPRVMSGKSFTSPVDDWAEASLEIYDPRTNSKFVMDVTTSWCGGFSFPFDIESDKGTLSIMGNRQSKEKEPILMSEEDDAEIYFGTVHDQWEPSECHIREIQIFCDNLLHGKGTEVDATYALRLQELISIQFFSKLMKKRVTLEEMDAWGNEILKKHAKYQDGVNEIALTLTKTVDLL